MFWSLLLEPGKRYTKVVDSPFHISAAVLDTTCQDRGVVRVIVDIGDTEALIANLGLSHGILQFPLDLQFDSGSRISFYTTGAKANVHLSGYMMYDEELLSGDDEGSSEDEEVPTLVSVSAKRKPEETPPPANKKAKVLKVTPMPTNKNAAVAEAKCSPIQAEKKAIAATTKANETVDLDEEEEEDEDEEDGLDESDEGEEEEEEDDDDDDDLEEEEEEDDSDDDDDDEVMEAPEAEAKKANSVAAKQGVRPTNEPFKDAAQTPKAAKTPKASVTPGSEAAKTPGGGPAKAKKTPNKAPGATATPTQNGKTPKSETPAKDQGKSPKTPKMVKQGGVMCEDLVVGKGAEAKAGKMVSVYYEGRLVSNKKMFDKCNSGKGFKFRLGGGEVIKGWDVGVPGMRIGGKRKVTCPPHMAYGKRGAPPDIPGNATLTFVVELKGVS